MRGGDAFRVELYAVDRLGFMHQAHDQAIRRFSGDLQRIGQRDTLNDQGVITRHWIGTGQPGEDAFAAVRDLGDFTMHRLGCANDLAAEGLSHGLQAEADSEQGDIVIGGGLYQAQADARMVRIAGAGRDDDTGGLLGQNFIHCQGIIPIDRGFCPQIAQILDEVKGKRVIVINQDQHAPYMAYPS